MNKAPTSATRQSSSIPVLNDLVSRGDKAPPEEEIDEIDSPYEIDSESPTVLPERKMVSEAPAEPEKAFSLDELTEIPIPEEAPNTKIPSEVNELADQILSVLMPKIETLVVETLENLESEKQLESTKSKNGEDST